MNDKAAEMYRAALQENGPEDARALLWGSNASQIKRFDVLLQNLRFTDFSSRPSIMDVGCGLGDLYRHILRAAQGGRIPFLEYHGVDALPEMVAAAQKKYPVIAKKIKEWNISEKGFDVTDFPYDYVVASGLFGLGATMASFQTAVLRMWQSCTIAVAFNCPSHRKIDDLEEGFYLDPSVALYWVQDCIAGCALIDHTYAPHDWTMVIRRRQV